MTFEHGAAACLKLGRHRWRTFALGVEHCASCDTTRMVDVADDDLAVYRQLLDELS